MPAAFVDVRDLARLRTDVRLVHLAVQGLLAEIEVAGGNEKWAVTEPLGHAESLLHQAQLHLSTAIEAAPKITVSAHAAT